MPPCADGGDLTTTGSRRKSTSAPPELGRSRESIWGGPKNDREGYLSRKERSRGKKKGGCRIKNKKSLGGGVGVGKGLGV